MNKPNKFNGTVLRNRLYEVELQMSESNLLCSLRRLGMTKFLKYLGLQETKLNELTCRQELLIDGSKS